MASRYSRGILRNATYKGCIVANKTTKLSFRSKKRRPCTKDEIIIVENMHEPIIEPDEWELVQQLITSRKRNTESKLKPLDNIFCGLLKCPDCGHTLTAKRSHRNYDEENNFANFDYYCSSYANFGLQKCSAHRNYAEITELSQSLLHTLIDKIEIHEPEDVDGEYIQKIDVYYKFVGKID